MSLEFLDRSNPPEFVVQYVPGRVYLIEEVVYLVLEAFSDDSELPLADYLQGRGRISLSNRWMAYSVSRIPAFWSRIVITPRATISVVQQWFSLTSPRPVEVFLRATRSILPSEYRHLDLWTSDIAQYVAPELYRCATLDITADFPHLVDDFLFFFEGAEPHVLRKLAVAFDFDLYTDFRPSGMQHFSFAHNAPIGIPFPPVTVLTWTSDAVHRPSVSFGTSSSDSICKVVHPHDHPPTWPEAMAVILSTPQVSNLTVDAVCLDQVPVLVTCSPPLFALTTMTITFRGSESTSFFVSRLNIPALRRLVVVITTFRDVQCLCACSAVLSRISELVFSGSCASGPELYAIYSLLHRVTLLDLRDVSTIFFSAFVVASRRPPPPFGANWNACPSLRRLLVRSITLDVVQGLLLARQTAGYAQLTEVVVLAPAGGRNMAVESWFAVTGVGLVILP
ncbi:hypothetical protein C8R47DRAFT_1206639 [Mycena vitilis]|nr:hypothetical protein C8R47DRAFT_1206639 [Mycena vitilis]